MKHLKKIFFIIALCAIFGITYSSPLGVDQIEVVDKNTLTVTLSENPNLPEGELDAEVTVLHDMKLLGGFPSADSANEVEVLLESPLKPNTSYSLLSILGAEGSIDFKTPGGVEGYVATNISSSLDQDIDTIEIIDDRTILVTYTEDLTSSTFEYKLLAESDVAKIEKLDFDTPDLTITVEPPFTSEQDYILMFIDMQDINGEFIEFDTGIYDFTSPTLEETTIEEEVTDTMSGSTLPEDTVMDDEVISNEENQEEETTDAMASIAIQEETNPDPEAIVSEDQQVDLEAAGEETSTDETLEADASIEDVAASATATPDTGAETWVLIVLTLLINSFYYFARRKKTQLA